MKIENIKYQSFVDFVNDVLLPSGSLYKKMHGFVYRGERTNKFKLIPGALREDNIDKLFRNNKPNGNEAQWLVWQVHAERTLLQDFYKFANYNGLKVPKVDAISRDYNAMHPRELLYSTGTYKWISDDIADLAALAQHYGVLTRLIDWSYELYVALYFACMGAIKEYEKPDFDKNDTVVIWALNAHYIQFLQPTISRIPLNFVVPLYHDNPNLNAQKGVLSYWEIDVPHYIEQIKELDNNFVWRTDRTPLDELLQKHCNEHPGKDDHIVLLYKLEFPVKDCIVAYEYLRGLGYTAAKIFPGYGGVVQMMDEDTVFQRIKDLMSNQIIESRNLHSKE